MSRLPPWFRRTLATFEAVFTDSRNVESFTALVSALILAETQWTVRGLARGISRPDEDAKSGRAYNYFFGGADWSAPQLARLVADYAFERLEVGDGNHVLLHIDDTFVGKTGDATDGVAEVYNPATGETELGNKFVTSCLQTKGTYVPYRAQMYVPEHLAPELAEHRWNIETLHQQSNAHFGFKQYQLERKGAIERYIHLVFLAWTLVTFAENASVPLWEDRGGLTARLGHSKETYLVETLLQITEEIDPSLPQAERRAALHERVQFFSWTCFALVFVA